MTNCTGDHARSLKFKVSVIPPLSLLAEDLLRILNRECPSIVSRTKTHVEYHVEDNTIRIYASDQESLIECRTLINNVLYNAVPQQAYTVHKNAGFIPGQRNSWNGQKTNFPDVQQAVKVIPSASSSSWSRSKKQKHHYLSMVLCNEPKLILKDTTVPNRSRLFHRSNRSNANTEQGRDDQFLRLRNIGEMYSLYSSRAGTNNVSIHFGTAFFRSNDSSLAEFEEYINVPDFEKFVQTFLNSPGERSWSKYFIVTIEVNAREFRLFMHPITRSKLECKKVLKCTDSIFDCYMVDSKNALDVRLTCFEDNLMVPSTNDITMKLSPFIKSIKYINDQVSVESTRHVAVIEIATVEETKFRMENGLFCRCEKHSSQDLGENTFKLAFDFSTEFPLDHGRFLKTVEKSLDLCKEYTNKF